MIWVCGIVWLLLGLLAAWLEARRKNGIYILELLLNLLFGAIAFVFELLELASTTDILHKKIWKNPKETEEPDDA